MCGIAGVFSPSGIDGQELERMGAALARRGPDDSAVWIDQQAGIGLAHRRLAILDLTQAGRQPMVSADGRYVMVCNGEIYNHPELRLEIERVREVAWRGRCDSETLIEAIALWGLQPALERCVGMFALGLWDRRRRELSLARDRFGEKPLYFGYVGGDFAFASELRASRGCRGSSARSTATRSRSLRPADTFPPRARYSRAFASSSPRRPSRSPSRTCSTGNSRTPSYWSYRPWLRLGMPLR